MGRKKAPPQEEVEDPNVLPVMNIMFLMIPALLLAMEIAKMAAVAVSPPKFAAAPSDQKEEEKPEEKPLKFKVFILADGFRVSTAEQQEGAEAGKAQDSAGGPSIPLAKPGAPMDDYERYDYIALEAKAKELKGKAKHETVVTLSAENDIPMQVLISTMDAVRGTDCKLLMLKEDEPMPEECLFFQPVVEAGAG
jgi:biopolymer transport protein ExbD